MPLLADAITTTAAAATATAVPTTGAVKEVTLFDAAFEKFSAFRLSEIKTTDEWFALGEGLATRSALVILLMFTAWTLAGWASTGVRTTLIRLRFDETLTLFLAKMARWGILSLTAVAVLSYFGVETASFAALLAATGFAIGLAFQGTLSNFAAGAMLLIFRPYKVGDEVNIAGYNGKVDEIELFTTTIDTSDNRRIIVPNSSIFGSVIENVTHHKLRRAEVTVGVSYAADIDETRRTLERAIDSLTCIKMDPKPKVVLSNLGPSSVDWSIRVWANSTEHGDVRQALIRAIKYHLDDARIEIPFPQMDIRVRGEELQGARLAA